LSCEVASSESVDLTYRFPIKVPGRPKPRRDVKEGSAGMTEVVDLAFRYVAMQYLGLEHHPIQLDEFGRTFDQAHKAASVNIIKAMADQNIFPQVFLISHDHGQYGALANCEVIVLNPLNVSTPAGVEFNRHVEMV
jgi:ABC-type hemin transport system ATPase subunit